MTGIEGRFRTAGFAGLPVEPRYTPAGLDKNSVQPGIPGKLKWGKKGNEKVCTLKRMLSSESDFGQVTECDCGTIHLTVGPVSVALNGYALRRLHALLARAIERAPALAEDVNLSEEEPVSQVH